MTLEEANQVILSWWTALTPSDRTVLICNQNLIVDRLSSLLGITLYAFDWKWILFDTRFDCGTGRTWHAPQLTKSAFKRRTRP